MGQPHTLDLTQGSVTKKLLSFTLPILLSSVLQHLYTIADRVVVGNFAENGKIALAAVGATGSATNLLIGLFNGISVGVNAICSNLKGAKQTKELDKAMHSAVLLSLILGFGLGLIGLFATQGILVLMGTPADVLEDATLYMQLYFLGVPASIAYNFGAAILRAHGDTRRPMYILGLTGLVNVGLNLLFVIGMHRGVDGVAIATVVSQYLSAFVVFWILFSPKEAYGLRIGQLKLHKAQTMKMVSIGIPCGLNGMLFSISNVILQSSINSFNSADIIAGNTAATDINNFFYLVSDAMGIACVSFSGQCCGAHQYRRLDKLAWSATWWGSLVLVVLAVLVTLFPRPLLGIFNSDPNVVEAGVFKLIVCGWGTVAYMAGSVMTGMVRGMGKSLTPMLLNIFSICGVRLIWVLGIFPFYREVNFLYLCYPISWACCSVLLVLYFFRCRKKLYANA